MNLFKKLSKLFRKKTKNKNLKNKNSKTHRITKQVSERVFVITIGAPKPNDEHGIIADGFEETLIFVGRLLEQLKGSKKGKYIHVVEHILSENGTSYVKGQNLFNESYLIE